MDLQDLLQSFPKQSGIEKPSAIDFEKFETIQAEEALGKTDKISGIYNEPIQLIYSRNIQVDISGLPSRLIAALKKLATFANPIFFEAQRMRRSTWDIPRYICCAELEGTRICLPRGLLNSCRELLDKAGSSVTIIDNRKTCYAQIPFPFSGELKPEQAKGFDALVNSGSGVLVAPPGSGKTVIGCALIGERKLPTLILVHRKQLADQWKSHLIKFLGMRKKEIGILSPDLKQRKGLVDIGMIQTISRLANNGEILSDYGMVIVDECHHVPAPSFEPALKSISSLHFIGLTATPYRKDGLQAIIHMQCGPTVYSMEENIGQTEIVRKAIIRETTFRMPWDSPPQSPIHEVWSNLVKDANRNRQIASDVASALKQGRFPLILSDRKDHLDMLLKEINDKCAETHINSKGFILTSDLGKKLRKKIFLEISEMLERKDLPFLLSTGSLIGEGFDLPALSTLVLAMPISFKGRLIQYAGRLHRESEQKTDALVYDYVDSNLGLGISMFRKRLTAYRKMGYQIDVADEPNLYEYVNKRRWKKNAQEQPTPIQTPSES
jgi:superfamily II DNA or RNA helicase